MRSFSYPHLRDRLRPVVKLPRTRLGRFTLYVFALDLLLYLVHELGRLFKSNVGSSLGGWIAFLVILGSVLLFIVLIRWIRQTVMWRLRNRLIVTYVFMAVIPVLLLVAMAGIAGWIFAGQFATFIVTSDIQQELKSLQAHNATLAQTMAAQLQHGRASGLPSLPFGAGVPAGHETAAWYRGRLVLNQTHGTLPNLPPAFVGKWFSDVVRDHGQLYLRAVTVIPVASDKLTVVSSEALGESLLNEVAADLGQIVLYGGGVNIDAPATGNKGEHPAGPGRTTPSGVVGPVGFGTPTTVGKLPPPSFRFDREVSFFAPIYYVDWQTGDRESASLMTVQTRVSRLYDQLFSTFGKRSGWAAIILGGIATVLLLIELVALVIGVRLTRTITRSVAELYAATQHVNRGDFGHQISVESQDQLAALETSFNSMTRSIQRLLAEQKEKQRMENELAIAQEVQSQLFPRQVSELESLEVHGLCRPARTVSGDYYDFVPLPPDRLMLAVGDVSGKGISAALLMATIHSAVRAFTLEALPMLATTRAVGADVSSHSSPLHSNELSPAALVTLLNQQLYRSTPLEKYATLFLGTYDGRARSLTYTNAGHLPPVVIGRDGTVRRLECGGTVVGLFDGMSYEESSVKLRDGDMFVAFSDGVTEPENDFGEFGEERLIELLRDYRTEPLARVSETVLAAVTDWIGGKEQPDDVTLVLARAR